MKHKGIPIKNVRERDGKIVTVPSRKASVSEKIRQKKSKRVTVKRRTP